MGVGEQGLSLRPRRSYAWKPRQRFSESSLLVVRELRGDTVLELLPIGKLIMWERRDLGPSVQKCV